MAVLIGKFCHSYTYLFEELPDPRTKQLFLVAKPYQVITIIGLYLMFVSKWGPKWMKKRPSFDLNKILMLYNFLQVLACAYIFISGIIYAWGWDYRWICEPVDFSNNYKAVQIANVVYCYFLLKIIDLADTIFFILKKKFNQVSFLHVYHHTGMVILIWGAVTYYPGGHGTLVGVINCFVHLVMYSYYFVTVTRPSIKQTLWWKKYITQLQILQFLLDIIHMSTIVFHSNCEYPRWIAALFLPQNIFMLILFVDFYIKAYIKKPRAFVRPRIVDDTKVQTIESANEIFATAITKRKNKHTDENATRW